MESGLKKALLVIGYSLIVRFQVSGVRCQSSQQITANRGQTAGQEFHAPVFTICLLIYVLCHLFSDTRNLTP